MADPRHNYRSLHEYMRSGSQSAATRLIKDDLLHSFYGSPHITPAKTRPWSAGVSELERLQQEEARDEAIADAATDRRMRRQARLDELKTDEYRQEWDEQAEYDDSIEDDQDDGEDILAALDQDEPAAEADPSDPWAGVPAEQRHHFGVS